MSKTKTLTDKQQKFLDALPRCDWDYREAAEIAGYSERSNPYTIADTVQDEIIEQARNILVRGAPKAAKKLVDSLDSNAGLEAGLNIKIQSAQAVLDRTGLGKREVIDVNVSADEGGLFILPAKS